MLGTACPSSGILGLCLSPVPSPHPWLGALRSSAQHPPSSDLVSSLPSPARLAQPGFWWGFPNGEGATRSSPALWQVSSPPGTKGPCLHSSLGGLLLPSWIPPLPNFPLLISPSVTWTLSQEPPPPGPLFLPQDLLHPPAPPGSPRLPWSQVLAFAAAVAQDGFKRDP